MQTGAPCALGDLQIAEQFCAGLGLTPERPTWVAGRDIGPGHAGDQRTGSERLVAAGEPRPGDHLLMVGRGPGAVFSCAVVQILEGPARARLRRDGREPM